MPVVINKELPAYSKLVSENIFVMSEDRANKQDIRPLKILIFNLMPTKITTETQILRLIGNTPLQIEVDFLKTSSYTSTNTSEEHLNSFYKEFDEISSKSYDGCIITGAPVENMEFEDVDYWEEFCKILEFTKHNVQSTLHICWAAQAGLYFHHNIPKYNLKEKAFGVFKHNRIAENYKLLRGFDDEFYAPHSRHTEVKSEDINKVSELKILSTSRDAGVYIVSSLDGRQIYVTGHSEYDIDTLALEYFRDFNKGMDINVPKGYFPNDDPTLSPVMRWKSHSNLLFNNWLNYYVYQATLFDLDDMHY